MSARRALTPLDRVERHTVLLGAVVIVLAGLVFLVSWTASGGLPAGGGGRVAVLLPDAAGLVKGDEARAGGARIGRVGRVSARTTSDGRIVARVEVRLDGGQAPLPVDSTASVDPVNLFGAKALTVRRGRASRTLGDGDVLALDRARRTVDLSDVLADVDAGFASRLRTVLGEAGTALAGRGDAIARLVPRTAALLPPARRVSRTLASPRTRLASATTHLAAVTGVLDEARGDLPGLLRGAARTGSALETAGPSVEALLDRAPRTAEVATAALRRATPVLDDLRALTGALRPGIDRLPATVAAAEDVLGETDRTLAPGTGVRPTLRGVAGLVSDVGDLRPDAGRVLADLRATSAPLGRTLRAIGDAEVHCNTAGLLARNLPAAVSGGDRAGAWLTGTFLLDPGTLLPSDHQAADLHLDPYPRQDAGGCVTANQRYRPGHHVGPAPADGAVLGIRAPADATERARRAGLLDDHEGGGR